MLVMYHRFIFLPKEPEIFKDTFSILLVCIIGIVVLNQCDSELGSYPGQVMQCQGS